MCRCGGPIRPESRLRRSKIANCLSRWAGASEDAYTEDHITLTPRPGGSPGSEPWPKAGSQWSPHFLMGDGCLVFGSRLSTSACDAGASSFTTLTLFVCAHRKGAGGHAFYWKVRCAVPAGRSDEYV